MQVHTMRVRGVRGDASKWSDHCALHHEKCDGEKGEENGHHSEIEGGYVRVWRVGAQVVVYVG